MLTEVSEEAIISTSSTEIFPPSVTAGSGRHSIHVQHNEFLKVFGKEGLIFASKYMSSLIGWIEGQ